MADNYLERREEQLRSRSGTTITRRTPSLDTLLLKNRSHRAFDNSDPVAMLQLRTIVSVNTRLPSGRNALIVRAFDRREVREYLSLPYEPLAVLAVGKGIDRIELETVPEGSDLRYYRKDGIHCVPKIRLEDLVL